jgi:hypothetical protein
MYSSANESTKRLDPQSIKLEHLRREFKAYRETVPNIYARRIPQDLREAVLVALQEGVAPESIKSACKISLQQIELWKRTYRAPPIRQGDGSPARVLRVVDHPQPRQTTRMEEGIELRIGPWHLQLRLDQALVR